MYWGRVLRTSSSLPVRPLRQKGIVEWTKSFVESDGVWSPSYQDAVNISVNEPVARLFRKGPRKFAKHYSEYSGTEYSEYILLVEHVILQLYWKQYMGLNESRM
jgi:hypothetical protein